MTSLVEEVSARWEEAKDDMAAWKKARKVLEEEKWIRKCDQCWSLVGNCFGQTKKCSAVCDEDTIIKNFLRMYRTTSSWTTAAFVGPRCNKCIDTTLEGWKNYRMERDEAGWWKWRSIGGTRPFEARSAERSAEDQQRRPDLMQIPGWLKVRYDVLRRDNFTCQACGATRGNSGRTMHVDHIKPYSKFPELALKMENLRVLCQDCNLGKGTREA